MMEINRIFLSASILGTLGLFFSAEFPSLALALQSTSRRMELLKFSGKQPIQIESKTLELRDADKTAHFSGDVKVVQGNTVLRAGEMVVFYKEGAYSMGGAIRRINVTKNVSLKSGVQQAIAETGSFDLETQVFVLNGKKVVLTEGSNIFIGCRLIVHMNTGEAKLESCDDRVKVQLDPKAQNNL